MFYLSILLVLLCCIGFEVAQESLKSLLVAIMVFPVHELADMPLSSQPGGPLCLCLLDGCINCDRKQDGFIEVLFLLKSFLFLLGCSDFIFYPQAVDRVLRKDHQQFVVGANSLLNPLWKVITDFEVFRGKPTSDAFTLQVGIQTFGKVLVLAGIANEAGVVLDWFGGQGVHILNEVVRCARPSYKHLWYVALRQIETINAQRRWSPVLNGGQSFDLAHISITKRGSSYCGIAEVGTAEVGTAEVGSAEVGSAEVGSAEVGISEVGSAEVGSAEVGTAEGGITEIGSSEAVSAEIDSSEVGIAEIGTAEVGIDESGMSEVGIVKIGTIKMGMVEVSFSKISTAEVDKGEIGTAEVGIDEVGSAEVGISEVDKGEISISEVGIDEVGSAEVGSAKISTAEVGSAEVDSDEVVSTEIGSAEVGIAEVGKAEVHTSDVSMTKIILYLWMFLSPLVPLFYALSKYAKLLLVCHWFLLSCSALSIEKRLSIRKLQYACSQ